MAGRKTFWAPNGACAIGLVLMLVLTGCGTSTPASPPAANPPASGTASARAAPTAAPGKPTLTAVPAVRATPTVQPIPPFNFVFLGVDCAWILKTPQSDLKPGSCTSGTGTDKTFCLRRGSITYVNNCTGNDHPVVALETPAIVVRPLGTVIRLSHVDARQGSLLLVDKGQVLAHAVNPGASAAGAPTTVGAGFGWFSTLGRTPEVPAGLKPQQTYTHEQLQAILNSWTIDKDLQGLLAAQSRQPAPTH